MEAPLLKRTLLSSDRFYIDLEFTGASVRRRSKRCPKASSRPPIASIHSPRRRARSGLARIARLPRCARCRQARGGAARLLSRPQPRSAGAAVRRADGDDQDLAAPQPDCNCGNRLESSTSRRNDDFAAAEFASGALERSRARRRWRRGGSASRSSTPRSAPGRRGSSPLAEATPPIAPPATSCRRSRRRIAHAAPRPRAGTRSSLDAADSARRAGAPAAIGATGIASRRSAWSALSRARRRAPTRRSEFVAILQKSPDFAAFMDLGELSTRANSSCVRAQRARPEGKSYELWIHPGQARRAQIAGRHRRRRPDEVPPRLNQLRPPAIVEQATYAVTVEPPRRLADGQPKRSRQVFVGKLIPVGPWRHRSRFRCTSSPASSAPARPA